MVEASIALIERMGDYAAKASNDTVSCVVARIVEKLQTQGAPFERRKITDAEKRIIDLFR